MTQAKLKLDEGDLGGAIAAAIDMVKKSPVDVEARTFLFELSLFSGEWDRADKQLDTLGHQDTTTAIGTLLFRQNIESERARINLFEHSSLPGTVGATPEHVKDLLRAVDSVRSGDTQKARELLDAVEENRPAFRVRVDDVEYEDFRDHNDLTMCVFEAFIKDSFFWIPFEDVVSIEFLEKKSLRDVYWPQAKVELTNGSVGEMFIPSMYVNTWKSGDDQIRLGRASDWRDLGDDVFVGEGTKMFWMAGTDRAILDISKIEFLRD
jgi:type VI secretion system protein ImpE